MLQVVPCIGPYNAIVLFPSIRAFLALLILCFTDDLMCEELIQTFSINPWMKMMLNLLN